MDAMLTTSSLIALAVTALAGLMRGFVGVGSGMLMAPIFAILFGPIDTVTIIIILEIVVTAQLLPGVRAEVDWRFVIPMGATAALFMPFGSWLLVSLDPELLSRGIALVVLVSVIVLMTGWRFEGEKRLPVTAGVGAASGVLMAATSLGNPPVIVYLLSSRDPASRNRANFTGYFAITLMALLGWMLWRGLIAEQALWRAALLVPVFMVAAWCGSRLFRKSTERLYRRVAFVLLAGVGVYGLLR